MFFESENNGAVKLNEAYYVGTKREFCDTLCFVSPGCHAFLCALRIPTSHGAIADAYVPNLGSGRERDLQCQPSTVPVGNWRTSTWHPSWTRTVRLAHPHIEIGGSIGNLSIFLRARACRWQSVHGFLPLPKLGLNQIPSACFFEALSSSVGKSSSQPSLDRIGTLSPK